jgi:hypothetical protein
MGGQGSAGLSAATLDALFATLAATIKLAIGD